MTGLCGACDDRALGPGETESDPPRAADHPPGPPADDPPGGSCRGRMGRGGRPLRAQGQRQSRPADMYEEIRDEPSWSLLESDRGVSWSQTEFRVNPKLGLTPTSRLLTPRIAPWPPHPKIPCPSWRNSISTLT